MAKVAVMEKFEPNTYYPKLKQYNRSGIRIMLLGEMVEIHARGFKPSSKELQDALEAIIKRDPFCGIAREGQQEMSTDAKVAVNDNIRLRAELDQAQAELRRMRETVELMKAAGGPASGR